MPTWLVKTEPSGYSFDDLVRDKKTKWEGVANPTAAKHLREMKKGDAVLVYHTGGERRVIGLAEVAAEGDAPELKAGKRLARPVGLDELKPLARFKDSPLVRMGRLSVVPLDAEQWKTILALAAKPA